MSLQPQEPLAIKRATIQDVARAAGVSASTVSHVLNATASISNETRERVLAAVEALQYYPNVTARSLRKKHTNVIGLLMQDMTSLFYSIAYERLLVRAQEKGYLLTMMCGHWDSELNAKNIATLIEHQAEGVIAMGKAALETDLKRASDRGLQVVLCDQYSPEFANVEYNNYTTMRRLVHCFAADDVTRISYVCTSIRRQDSIVQRYRGYVQGMLDEGLDPDKLLIALDLKESKYFRWNKQFDRFTDFLEATPRDKWPQVVLCEHDAIAQAVVYSATRKGVRIPEEIQVFGFDDTSHAVLTTPKLSTVRQDPEQLADEAFDMLMAMLQGQAYPRHVQLEQKIVLRESGNILKDHLERERLPYCIQMEAEEPALFRPEM